jgi:hypothetical protein
MLYRLIIHHGMLHMYLVQIKMKQNSSINFVVGFSVAFTYSNLLEIIKEDALFQRWLGTDAFGKMSTPIELCLLGTLRYLCSVGNLMI